MTKPVAAFRSQTLDDISLFQPVYHLMDDISHMASGGKALAVGVEAELADVAEHLHLISRLHHRLLPSLLLLGLVMQRCVLSRLKLRVRDLYL